MEGDSPKYAEALVVRGSEIAFVGDKSKAFAFADLEATNECNDSAQQKSPVKTQRP